MMPYLAGRHTWGVCGGSGVGWEFGFDAVRAVRRRRRGRGAGCRTEPVQVKSRGISQMNCTLQTATHIKPSQMYMQFQIVRYRSDVSFGFIVQSRSIEDSAPCTRPMYVNISEINPA